MHVRGTLAALALTGLLAFPMLASASIVQRWQSFPAHYELISGINDFDNSGHFEMLTGELASGGAHVGVRSTSTGALLAQTTFGSRTSTGTTSPRSSSSTASRGIARA